ncbi:unnamed protein product [Cladocopium goreaui]|uniref:WW domain-containing protein n=1 Tax=Cladocopium goreaui TaxID=2562237 RepID=A0A9P1GHK9_9DINO|nr:unnamed protein product [Cladocopium goreaui]
MTSHDLQDWSPSRNRDRDHRNDRDDQDDRDDRRRPRDSRPEPEGPPAQRRRTSSAERAPEPSSKEEWIRAQDRLFGHLKPLPNNWIRITSKSSGNIYFYNTKTGESTFEEPSGS